MQHPDDGGAQHSAERLQVGPARPSSFGKVPAKWRLPAVAFVASLFGVAAGASAVQWWHARPAPPPVRAHEHAVELVLVDAVRPRTHPGAHRSDSSPLDVVGAVLLSGGVTSTVLDIGALGRGLEVHAPALPLTVSPTGRFQSVDLRITVRECEAATRWATGDRPFTIRWRDEYGEEHQDRAGDFGRSMALSLVRYIDAVCDNPRDR